MKNISKKVISVVLSIIFALSCFAVLGSVGFAAEETDGTIIPTIYVQGTGMPLYVDNEDGSRSEVYPISIPDGFIEETVKENIGVFAKAVLTQEWAEFGDVLADALGEIFSVLQLDEHGQTQNGVYLKWTWDKNEMSADTVNGKYPTQRYTFNYDWRLDPYHNADLLRQFIEDVREVTGAEKVAMCGRCLGANITMAYMEKYDAEYISDYIIYCSAMDGATQCSKAFAGDLYLDSDGIERYLYDFELSEDSVTNELIQAFVTVFNRTYGLDLTCAAVNNVVQKKYYDIYPKALLNTFATFPGYWSMVNDRDYDRAKDVVFHDEADKEKYADFIEIIDNYHYNVQMKSNELLESFAERGVEVANITKYGFQTIPVTDEADMISDAFCSVYDASKGATTATLTEGFSDEYIENTKLNGTYKYISPDRQIDASTCLMPERTWFVKNVKHALFPKVINRLIDAIVNNDGFTVDSDENFTQYMVYSDVDESFVPMTAENMNTDAKYDVSFFDALKKLFENLFVLIKRLIESNAA